MYECKYCDKEYLTKEEALDCNITHSLGQYEQMYARMLNIDPLDVVKIVFHIKRTLEAGVEQDIIEIKDNNKWDMYWAVNWAIPKHYGKSHQPKNIGSSED